MVGEIRGGTTLQGNRDAYEIERENERRTGMGGRGG